MKPTKVLISALLAVADKLENTGIRYDWGTPEHCNCGLLAREIMGGISGHDLVTKNPGIGTWTLSGLMNGKVCEQTGLPLNEVAKALHLAGIRTRDDLEQIEFCGTGYISCPESTKTGFSGRKTVAKYFRKLAAELQEKRKVKA